MSLGLISYSPPSMKSFILLSFSFMRIRFSTFFGASLFLLAVAIFPPVLNTLSDFEDDAGIAKIFLAIFASIGKMGSCFLHQWRIFTLFPGFVKLSYLSISLLIFELPAPKVVLSLLIFSSWGLANNSEGSVGVSKESDDSISHSLVQSSIWFSKKHCRVLFLWYLVFILSLSFVWFRFSWCHFFLTSLCSSSCLFFKCLSIVEVVFPLA